MSGTRAATYKLMEYYIELSFGFIELCYWAKM